MRFNEVLRVSPSPVSNNKRETAGVCPQRKDHEKVAICNLKAEASERTKHHDILILGFQPPKQKTMLTV